MRYLLPLLFLIFLSSCDHIENPYPAVSTDLDTTLYPGLWSDYVSTEWPSFTQNQNINRNILIEDFTGHTCQNCPEAAKELEAIHDVYGDQIIGIAIHVVKSFARPYPESAAPKFQYDFRTEWGNAWESLFEITSLPKGMVNRIGYPDDNHRLGKDEWLSQVQNELNKTNISIPSWEKMIDELYIYNM